MKWIGQHIYDLVSRFRDDVYLEDLTTTTETNVLVVDSTGKVSKSTTLADDLESDVEASIDTLANLTSFGAAGATTNIVAGDLTMYNAVNDGAPTISLGSSAAERLEIIANYVSGTQLLSNAHFKTYTAPTTTDRGRFIFSVDEVNTMQIVDAGIDLQTSKALQIDGTNIISDSGGTATLSNIDLLDNTTIDSVTKGITTRGWDPDDKNITPTLDGSTLHLDACTYTDNNTSEGATSAADFATVSIEGSTLAQAAVPSTTTNAATLYIKDAVTAGTNKTITNSYALWVDSGNARFDGNIDLEGDIDVNGTLETDALTIGGAVIAAAGTEAITTVGTIGTGIWQGTTIKTAYIGDDQVTEDKLANTLLAEIDANTDKATNVTTNLTASTHASKITINSSDGTNVVVAEASGSIAGLMTVAHHDKLDGIETSATADQTKSDIDGLAITTVGTIDTGVWNGTAIGGNYIAATQPNIDSIGTDGDALTILGDTLAMTNATASKPVVQLQNTTDDASGPFITMVNQRGGEAGEDGDDLGTIRFGGYDDQGTPALNYYASILGEIHDATSGEESGKLTLSVANHDAGMGAGLILTGGSADNEIDVTVGLGANSVVTIPGNVAATGSLRGKQIQVYHANWKGAAGTGLTYIPLAGVPDETIGGGSSVGAKESNVIVMPAAGKVKEIILRQHWASTITTSDDITWTVYNRTSNKKTNAFSTIGSTFTMVNPTQGADDANNTRTSGEISYAFAEYDALAISMQWAATGPTNNGDRVFVTVVVEYDFSGIGY